LLFGVFTLRALIRLARMAPTRPSAQPKSGARGGEPARHEPPDPLFDGASARRRLSALDLALAGARSACLQHLENLEGRDDPGGLRFFAVKRIARLLAT
jgi:hypothetical protein